MKFTSKGNKGKSKNKEGNEEWRKQFPNHNLNLNPYEKQAGKN